MGHKWTPETHYQLYQCLTRVSKVSSRPLVFHFSFLSTSLLLDGQRRRLRQSCPPSTRFVQHGLARKTKMFQKLIYMYTLFHPSSTFSGSGAPSPKPPCPPLMLPPVLQRFHYKRFVVKCVRQTTIASGFSELCI